MSLREIFRTMLQLFFPIWGMSFLVSAGFALILKRSTIYTSEVYLLLGFALACTLALLVFYSSKQLSNTQIIVRYCIHFSFVAVSAATIMIIAGWIQFRFIDVSLVMLGQIPGYASVAIFDWMHAKRLTVKLNQQLKEYQKYPN